VESALAGLILDSSVMITGERQNHTVRQILEQIQSRYGETEIWGSALENENGIEGLQPPSSTLVWGWRQFYAPVDANPRHYGAT
jgi:hypothetical protein